MNVFAHRDGVLHAESVSLEAIAREFGTPCYVYSRAALENSFREFALACSGHDVLICYAMKANSNLAILDLFARLGAGFDIVSGGELARVIAAGARRWRGGGMVRGVTIRPPRRVPSAPWPPRCAATPRSAASMPARSS